MKKLLLFFVACIPAFVINANPVYAPSTSLSAFYFNEDQHWRIELMVYTIPDSILISSTRARSLYKGIMDGLIIITQDSLKSGVNIDPEGDSVSIVTYFTGYSASPDSLVETFVFGNYRDASLPKLSKGQAVTRFMESFYGTDYHCIRDSLGNLHGALQGKIYDRTNQLITSGLINISPFPAGTHCFEINYHTDCISINGDGTYSAPLYAMKYQLDTIWMCSQELLNGCILNVQGTALKIDSMQFTIIPDNVVERDIHVKNDFAGVHNKFSALPEIMMAFPNPVTSNGFSFQTSIPVKSTRCFFELINAKGQITWQEQIMDNTGNIELPLSIPDGMYYLKLRSRDSVFCTSNLQISRR